MTSSGPQPQNPQLQLEFGNLEAGAALPTAKRARVPSSDPRTIFSSTVTAATSYVAVKMKELTALSSKVAAVNCTIAEKGYVQSFFLTPPPILPVLHTDFASVQKEVDKIFLESATKASSALQRDMQDRIKTLSDQLSGYENSTLRSELEHLIFSIGEEVVDPEKRALVTEEFKKQGEAVVFSFISQVALEKASLKAKVKKYTDDRKAKVLAETQDVDMEGTIPSELQISEVVALQVNKQVKAYVQAQKKVQQDSFEGLRDSLRAELYGSTSAPPPLAFPRPPFPPFPTPHPPPYPPPHYQPILPYPGYAPTPYFPPRGGRGGRGPGRGASTANQPPQPSGPVRGARGGRGAGMRTTRGVRGGQGRRRGVDKGF